MKEKDRLRFLLFVMLFTCFQINSYADVMQSGNQQAKMIVGTVVDKDGGQLPGVSIYVKGQPGDRKSVV